MSGKVFNPKDKTYIVPSSTWLYFKSKDTYYPYEVRLAKYLESVRLALIGNPKYLASAEFNNTYVRFGWLDKNLNSLQWVPISELLNGYKNKTLTKKEKAKLSHVCRLLFISVKDIKI